MRKTKTLTFQLSETFKTQLLSWAQQYDEVVWLDSNNYPQEHSHYKAILAVDAFTAIKTDYYTAFEKLNEYQQTTKDWLFGYLTYDLKNDVEHLSSQNFDALHFADLYFFQPKKIFLFSETEVTLQYLAMVDDELDSDWEEILDFDPSEALKKQSEPIKIRLRTSKDTYFEKLNEVLQHIKRGDIYEANFCQEFYSENASINPVHTFFELNAISKPPFATFLKLSDQYALSASPERYLQKVGNRIVSQPIKGTAKRLPNPSEDKKMREQLANDPKERSENIMITDLVRNDLSRIAEKGSVTVNELCKIYTFEQVHQMISTISCTVSSEITPVRILKNTFPMGSMTGAPKVSAMQIIEDLEISKRGLYSGAVGYFTPNGDFDFNVIIRSILYNAETNYVSYSVGGAITAKSIPESEYEECLLKAKAMREVLEG
ncbi:aminodeoxychorismate synthase component I [Ulvibacter litoralis]|uniref:aminodeoxychorismate synthase n=1 Tax=Ulvibacter litoralis TaxID=227084 RepID=A0A1G7HCB2_9FLAO|nr:aminodeoxychorismate synthase component I [Ulvibacter litoralis]GHC57270.1 para-aminobenzoate synthase [Ulvibacter litoralis]SDE98090.1 para-aminobenzoate synthetase component 1 [Ulvibacter litoralis]